MAALPQTVLTIVTLIRMQQLSHDSLNARTQWDDTYDYIVVGGGTAGPIVAARLAENPNDKVLLIEAGKPQNLDSDIPAFSKKLLQTEWDWNFPIVPQKYSYFAYVDNSMNITRGKGFGGCLMHNEMNYYRETPSFFRFWTDISGVKNWTYEDVLPYFRKFENNLDRGLVNKYPNIHSIGGPVSVSTAVEDPLLVAYLGMSQLMGYPMLDDRREPFGSTIMQRTIRDGVRQTTSKAYLENNNRRNLHILGETLVTKVLFSDGKRAIGVQFYRDKEFHNVLARKEVILSAGSVGSPKLLLQSGIGPKQHLDDMRIPIVADLRVGEDVHTEPFVIINFDVKDQTLIERPDETFENYENYFLNKAGPLTYKASGMTCFPEVHYPGRPDVCNGAILPRISFLGNDLEKLVSDKYLKDQWREYYRPYINRTNFILITGLKRPQSKGTIRLATTNPFDNPVIDPCLLCKEPDLTDAVKTFKLAIKMFTSPLMQPFIEPFKGPIPGCKPCANDFYCDEYVKCYIQTFTEDTYPNGGCRIGVSTDKNAVVDQRLRVIGVTGLRVVDASILPVSTDQSGALTLMIGEYGADMIKQDNNGYSSVRQGITPQILEPKRVPV